MILDHIFLAKQLKLDYLYLGYWIRRNNKMGYKADYRPAEVYHKDKWVRITKENVNTLNLDTGPNLPSIKKSSPEIESIIQLPRFSTDPN